MRESYIKQVKRELAVSAKRKKEVVRDLREAFSSALEHGESEQEVMERLGSPREFAEHIQEQFGAGWAARKKRKMLLPIWIAAIISVLAFSVSSLMKAARVPGGVIGQGDAMTSIKVEGAALDPMIILLAIGAAALAAAALLAVRYARWKNREKE